MDHYEPSKIEIPRIEKKLGDVKNSEKSYEEAIQHYKNSIMALKILFDEDASLNEDDKKAAELIEEVGIPVHLNLAFCYLKLEDWKNVIFYCNKVLELKPEHVKAIYRRCKAFLKLKEIENAVKDIDTLEKLLGSESEEIKLFRKNYEEIKIEKEKEMENVYENIAKKSFRKNPIKNVSNKRNEENSLVDKFKCIIFSIPQIGTNLILFGVDTAIKLPLKIAYNSSILIKNLVWDVPLTIASNVTNTVLISPAKWILRKFNPFAY